MKRGKTYAWIPLWIDKWLWGSTRHELAHDERAIFTDLLALAAKDDGWIRANPNTPYPLEQLAGMLCATVELVKRTIDKALEYTKLNEPSPGIYRISSWGEYQLTDRRKRDLIQAENDVSVKTETGSSPEEPLLVSVSVSSKSQKEKEGEAGEKEIGARFGEFWSAYPREGRLAKQESRRRFAAIVRKGELQELIKGFHGYLDFLKHKRVNEGFEQRPMYAKTFLNDRWREFIGFKYQPKK